MHLKKIKGTKFANLEFFVNFHSLIHFSVGNVLVMASLSEKKSEVFMRCKVRGCNCTTLNLKKGPRFTGCHREFGKQGLRI
jgi:hypothetical protein